MAIHVENLARQMLLAAEGVLREQWPEVRNFVESETKKFAQNMAEIELWKNTGQITEDEAKAPSRLHQRSMKMVLTASEGISLALAEKAINTALDVVRNVINTAIGWAIV